MPARVAPKLARNTNDLTCGWLAPNAIRMPMAAMANASSAKPPTSQANERGAQQDGGEGGFGQNEQLASGRPLTTLLPGGDKPEEQAGQRRNQDAEAHGAQVQRDFGQPWRPGRQQLLQGADLRGGEDGAQGAAKRGQQQSFGE